MLESSRRRLLVIKRAESECVDEKIIRMGKKLIKVKFSNSLISLLLMVFQNIQLTILFYNFKNNTKKLLFFKTSKYTYYCFGSGAFACAVITSAEKCH